ncbi:MAG: hypothetical protein MJ102_00265 [Clostridia bacterium]|nr:hypothetical protein [Clostridia bacterium]
MWIFWFLFCIENLFINFALQFLPEGQYGFSEETYIWLTVITTFILLLCMTYQYRNDRKLLGLFLGALTFRILVFVWIQYFSDILLLPNSGYDEWTFYYNAISHIVNGTKFSGYPAFLGWQFTIYGSSMFFGRFINILFSMSALSVINATLHKLNISEKTRYITMALACFLPNYAIMSAVLLRESLLILLVSICIYFFTRWWYEDNWKFLLISIIISLPAVWLHSGTIAFTGGIACLAITSTKKDGVRRFKIFDPKTMTICIVGFVAFMLVTINTGIGDELGISAYFRGADSISEVVSISQYYVDGASAYNANIINSDSLPAFIINTPTRILYFMLSPMPWDWRGLNDIIAFFLSGVFYFGIFVFAIYSIFKRKSEIPSMVSALFFASVLVLFIFSWGCSNSGTALRHRDKMIMLYLVEFALLWDKFEFKSKKNKKIMEDPRSLLYSKGKN